MYYSTDLFVRRGPLGVIWLASHKKDWVKRDVILAQNITQCCRNVEDAPVVLALPAQSTLMKGIVNLEAWQWEHLKEQSGDVIKRWKYAEKKRPTEVKNISVTETERKAKIHFPEGRCWTTS